MLETKLNICLAPIEIFWGNKDQNLTTVKDLFQKLNPETDIVVLPETFSTGFPSIEMQKEIELWAETNEGPTVNLLKELSRD